MPYHKRLRKKGVNEKPFPHAVKLLWFEVHFDDIYDEISLYYFCNHFSEIVKSRGIEWEFKNKDGSLKTPEYSTVKTKWYDKYEWETQYHIFKTDKLQATRDTARERIERRVDKDTITDLKQIDSFDEKHEKLINQEKMEGIDNTYRINKNQETKNLVTQRLYDRVGYLNEVEETAQELVPVDDNPVWEDDSFLESRREMLWRLVNKRGDD
ncbi:MAG: hypothetical protein J6M91_09330 [Methanobrevibacter sp.]|nr:hypothetical protein [Methanobrevibacter sp.]